MCTTTCRTAVWPLCRCECNYENHGVEKMTALTAPVPRHWSEGRGIGSDPSGGGTSSPEFGSPLFGVDLLHIESWLEAHRVFRDEVPRLVRLATPAGESERQGTAAHAACTVLVSVVMVLEKVDDLRAWVVDGTADALSTAATTMIQARLGGDAAARLEPLVAAVCAYIVDAALPELPLVDSEVLMALRLAAVVACPDLDDHADVVEHCVRPLVTTLVEDSDLT